MPMRTATHSIESLELKRDELNSISSTGGLVRSKSYFIIFRKLDETQESEFLDGDGDETGIFSDMYPSMYDTYEEAEKFKNEHLADIQEEIDGYDGEDPDDAENIAAAEKELKRIEETWLIKKLTFTLSVQPADGTTGSDVLNEAYKSVG